MPKLKITTQARLTAIMPGAVAGGYTIARIAKECGCGRKAAATALRAYQSDMENAAALDGGRVADDVRRVATLERERVTVRLSAVGALCDSLLDQAGALLRRRADAVDGLGGVGGASLRSDLPLDDLERLAGILAKASKMAESSWRLFRSASGLEMAERVTEMQAKQRIKGGKDQGETWEADYTLIEPGH